jgi:alkylation response protein AidB-like acyl-CoA dehydrogenase
MYYQLTEEQSALRERIRQVAEEKVAPRAAELDRTGEFPWDLKEEFSKMGILGSQVLPEYGGSLRSQVEPCIVVEEIARCCAASSTIPQVQGLGWLPIQIGASEEQKKKYGPKVASGEALIAFGLTEPQAGSDAAAMETRAVRDGDKWVLNGRKHFILNGPICDLLVVFAMTEPDKGTRGISAFILDTKTPGFSVTRRESKMGIRASPTGQLAFDDVDVPAENLIGEEGRGFSYAMQTLDHSRPVVAGQAVGIAQGALDCAIEYAKHREQFGQPVAAFQGLSWMLADAAAQIEAARALTYQAASMLDSKDPRRSYMSACAKMVASDVAMRVTTDCVQIAGGYGYMTDMPLERMMRDAKITQIYEGTNQIQKLVISRELLK